MVERKTRPAPLTLVARKSAKPAGKPGPATRLALAAEALRARHQRADARPHEPLPVRGARHLPADPHARGARQQQERRHRSRAQRAAGFALSRRARHPRCPTNIGEGIPLDAKSGGAATGRLYLQTEGITTVLPASLANGKADNQILAVVMHLQHLHPKRHVILVTKDINMRIKARALGIAAEDYFNDKVLEDTELLYSGMTRAARRFLGPARQGDGIVAAGRPHVLPDHRPAGAVAAASTSSSTRRRRARRRCYALVKEINGRTAVLQTLKDYTHQKNNVWGITARNREQNFALNLLMNPDVDFVTLLGQAGTGKTLLTLAAGLMLTLEFKVYSEIIMTRVTVPVGEDIGFLPGTEEEKMNPWMGALEDNLDVLNKTDDDAGEWGRAATRDLIRSRIKVKSLNFMRGRTFINKFLIIDEAQNLTPKQMKTLVTRAGPGHQGRLPRQHRADRHALPHRRAARASPMSSTASRAGRTRAT